MVLELRVPRSMLRIDPEDCAGDTVEEEFEISARTSMPAKFTISAPIGPEVFSCYMPFSFCEPVEEPGPDDAPDMPGF